MLQLETLPATVVGLLTVFRSCFTAPTYRTFVALLTGLIAQPARRTVCGMLVGAGLAGAWPHQRAHRLFSRAVWDVEHLSLVLLRLVVTTLVPAGADLEVAVDDTLFKRSGVKVYAARWQHDGSATGPTRHQLGRGNGWVVAAVNVHLPFMDRVLALPVGFALWGEPQPARPGRRRSATKGSRKHARSTGDGPTKQVLASRLLTRIAQAYPDRRVHAVADTWYAGMGGAKGATRGATKQRGVPANVTITSRPRSNAAFDAIYQPAPGTKNPGRPRVRDHRLGTPAEIAATAEFIPITVTRYAQTATVLAADIACLWYGVYRGQHLRLILVLDDDNNRARPYTVLTTDLDSTTEAIIGRYANRWSIEVAFHDAKHITGVGQAHNRTRDAVLRTVPFGLTAQTITIIWYAQHGYTPDTTTQRRAAAPWYQTKTTPSYLDMIVKLRRVLIAARFRASGHNQPTHQEIQAIRQAWAEAAA